MTIVRLDRPPPRKSAKYKTGCVWLAAVFFGLTIIGSLVEDKTRIGTKLKTGTDHKTIGAPKSIPAVVEKPKAPNGFDCLSKWDGSHRKLVNELKRTLRDPDSFKHIETRLAPSKTPGEFVLFMDYRAQNGFGGMAVGKLAATMKQDCSYWIEANVNQ